MAEKIKVIVSGALGKMGFETVKAVINDKELELVGAVDIRAEKEHVGQLTGIENVDIVVENNLDEVIERTKPDVMIDFTIPQAVYNNAKKALSAGITCIIGTTGLNDIELEQLENMANNNQIGIAVIPNFAIGAVLMMKFAQDAAKYFPDVEIIELHHDKKMDAPSGTALKTVQMVNQNRTSPVLPNNTKQFERISGCRGGNVEQIRVHSIRLPGLIAHQEVIFGGQGQSLKIRHDSYDRSGFMPGVVLVAKKMVDRVGLIYGMENLI